jgi:reactive intermediate/imine deaminase
MMKSTPANVRFINPETMPPARGYSHVAEVSGGRTIYLSGQIALDQDGKLVGEGDMRAQARQVFENLKAGLEAAGVDFSHVVKLNFYVLDATQMQAVRDVRDQYINTANPPASTALEVRNFVREGLLLEVDAVAVVPN